MAISVTQVRRTAHHIDGLWKGYVFLRGYAMDFYGLKYAKW